MSTKHSSLTGADLHYSKVKAASGNPNSNSFSTIVNSYVGDIYLDTDTNTTYVRKTFTGTNDWSAAPIQHIGSHPIIFTTTGATSLILPTSGTLLSNSTPGSIPYSLLNLTNSITDADVFVTANISLSKLLSVTANRALISDVNGKISASGVTGTELSYLSGVSSSIQAQLNAKQGSGDYITALTGDVTASGAGSVTATIGAGKVTNGMLAGSIDDTKLATIATTNKVANSATTATSANVADKIVLRDGNGFSAFKGVGTQIISMAGATNAGDSYVFMTSQSASPPTPSAGKLTTYLNSSGWPTFLNSSGKRVTLDISSAITSDRVAAFPNQSGTIVIDSATQELTYKTISGVTNIFSNIPNSATTATSANVADKIVTRDGSGSFAANAVSATQLKVIGTAGSGFLELQAQSPDVGGGAAGVARVWTANNAKSLILTPPNGFFGELSFSTLTGSKTFTFPDAGGNVVIDSATQTLTNKTLTSPAITAPTGIVKADVGLSNVDNTSDSTKNSASATLLNKLISSTSAITGALTLPTSTTANRPTPVTGMVRHNTTTGFFEGYYNGAWRNLDKDAGYRTVACVLRNTAGTWAIINDVDHEPFPTNMTVSQTSTYVTLNYGFTASHVTTLVACPDETYVANGICFGSSVDLDKARIYYYRNPYEISGYVAYASGSWSVTDATGGLAFSSYSSGILTLSHDVTADSCVSVTPRGSGYRCTIGGLPTTTTSTVEFYNITTGAGILGAADSSMKFFFRRRVNGGSAQSVATADMGIASSNIWIYGLMKL